MNHICIRSYLLLFTFLLFLHPDIWSQRTSRGIVYAPDSEPLEGASVLIKGTTVGMFTNPAGEFYLKIPDEVETPILVITYVGFEKKEVLIKELKKKFSRKDTITLVHSDITIEYSYTCCFCPPKIWQNTGEREYTGAKDYQNFFINSPEQLLMGELNFLQNCNDPLNQPLYVLDGVPLPPMTSSSFAGNPLSFLNSSEIEDIYVAKPSLGMSKYGSQAMNGLVRIETSQASGISPKLTYIGGRGISKNLERDSVNKGLNQHNLLFEKSGKALRIRSNVFFRDLTGFGQEDRHRNIGGNIKLIHTELLKRKLWLTGQFSFNKMFDKSPLQTISRNNLFSSLQGKYYFPGSMEISLLANKFQHESPDVEKTKGSFVESKITHRASILSKHWIYTDIRYQYRDFTQENSPSLKQHSLNLEAEYENKKKFNTRLNMRKEQSLINVIENPAHSFYASLGIGKEIKLKSNSYLGPKHLELMTHAGLAKTPFLESRNLNFATELSLYQRIKIKADYCIHKIDEIDEDFFSSSNTFLLFPQVYENLENKGINLSVEGSHMLFDAARIIFDVNYNRGNGLSKDRFRLSGRVFGNSLSFNWRFEGIRGWNLSGAEQDLFRLADTKLSYKISTRKVKWMKGLCISLSSQNLVLQGDRQVLFDQIEIARRRNPSLFPTPLAKNLLLGIRMDLI